MKRNWNLVFRRTHLYLGILLVPWLMIYALSTLFLNHGEYFRQFRPADPQFLPLWEKDYVLPFPVETGNLREAAQRILQDNGLNGAFGVQRQGSRLNINLPNFLEPKRLNYDLETNRLRAEEKKFAWVELAMRLHFRTGYHQPGVLTKLWAVIVDLFCLGLLVWIGTGLYLWWKLPDTRRWGLAVIGGGILTIISLLLTL